MLIPVSHHRGQRKPWSSIPRIDWSHPLTRGLISYGYDVGFGPIDLVTGGQCTITNTASPPLGDIQTSKYGTGLRSLGIASTTLGLYNLPGNTAIEGLCVAAPYSFACGLMMVTNPNAYNVLFSTCNATSVSPVQIGINGSTTDFWWAFAFGAAQISPSGAHRLNQFQTLLGVALTGSTTACYIDGALSISPSVTTTRAADSGVKPSFFGWRSLNPQPLLNGFVYYGALWKNRALTAAEARLLHDDPYCFLIYPEDEILALLSGSSLMTLWLSDRTIDAGLSDLVANCDRIHICSQRPTTFAEVGTYSLGYKHWGAGAAFGSITDGSPDGRVTTANVISNGTVTANGTAAWWAAVDNTNSYLFSVGQIIPVAVLSGQTFSLTSFTIHQPAH